MNFQIPIKKAAIITEEMPTTGHLPLKVITDDLADTYFAKSSKGIIPGYTIISEFLCSQFLKIWEIPTPEIAAIIIDPELIDIPLNPTNKKSYYENICFGSKEIPEAFEISRLVELSNSPQYSRIENLSDFAKIGLFDIWVENDDRKPLNPNLILAENNDSGKLKLYAIDHAYTFATLNYEALKVEWGVTLTEDNSILYSDFIQESKKIKKIVSKGNFQDLFYQFVLECENNFHSIAENIPSELGFDTILQDSLFTFLFNKGRNKIVFEEFVGG